MTLPKCEYPVVNLEGIVASDVQVSGYYGGWMLISLTGIEHIKDLLDQIPAEVFKHYAETYYKMQSRSHMPGGSPPTDLPHSGE